MGERGAGGGVVKCTIRHQRPAPSQLRAATVTITITAAAAAAAADAVSSCGFALLPPPPFPRLFPFFYASLPSRELLVRGRRATPRELY